MAKRYRKTQKSQTNLGELALVAFAEDVEQAKDYETLLKANDIPAMIKEEHESEADGVKGIAVLVPEDFLDEAHVIIESQDVYEGFYDFASPDEGENDFGAEFSEEEDF